MSKKNYPELILDTKCVLGEGPWWDYNNGILYFIDGLGEKLFIFNPITGQLREFNIGLKVGCAIPIEDDGLLLCLQNGVYRFNPDTQKLIMLNNIEHNIINNRLNDGKCDTSGRLWFGSMSMTANQEGREFEYTGTFYNMDCNLNTRALFSGVGISNGIAWNEQDTVMYYIDSPTRTVVSFDFDIEKGSLSNKRVVLSIDQSEGIPDGMTIDAQGMLWIAHFGGAQVSCWNPHTGEKIKRIDMPALNVTSCCFGGKELNELYITTARTGLSSGQLGKQPYAGGLFKLEPGVCGTRLNKFKLNRGLLTD